MTNNQDWENLNEQELIEILKNGKINEKNIDEFMKVLEKKGMNGSIMRVDNLAPEEEKALKEYLDYHKNIPKNPQSPKEISQAIKVLSDSVASLESLKKAIITLAHTGKLDAYEALENYAQNPRKELSIWLQQALQECKMFLKSDLLDRPVVEKGDIESVSLGNEVLANDFFQDFLTFLKSLKEHPLELTVNNNLQLKEIEKLGKIFKTDIYHRSEKGEVLFPIRSEEEVFHLQFIRVLGKIMKLSTQRKNKLKITRFGLKFLEFSPFEQFVDIILNYLGEYNWAYLRSYAGHNSKSIPEVLQKNQGLIYSRLMFEKDWLDFKNFAKFLKKELALTWDYIDGEIETLLVKDLARFGLIEYEEKKKLKGYFEEVSKFRLTKLGRLIIPMYLETYNPPVALPKGKNINVVLPTIKLKYLDKGKNVPKRPDARCHFCDKTNIVIGAYLDTYTNSPKVVCEDCAIDNYQKDFGYKTREIAMARRRRMFDVTYLFFEMVLDQYLAQNKMPFIENINEVEYDRLMNLSREVFNASLSRQEKIELEETYNQSEIEERLRELLKNI
ncbi:MAG: hypothetical protein US31_C0002G0078 [Berkelbacteria bacterium GW2011_GWA1_36_9]|uniref:Uncharacterized protein n=1 Tax=Berkelbacteria bacterium GW2011_GWA1_36_9 TaxID=1618331 RepID=A0A0G0FI77_9BACT|nr:MAG: hypothetical protein US31_C0002G0078 [Berkelbacteria bacterium GW2011_GWA1_36_9]